jgi:hypothetical protein
MSSVIINNIRNIENLSYLELGVFKNQNFYQIKCRDKYSVDINGNAIFTGTTDEFFSQIDKNKIYDIIFIDANHDYEYVLRDFNNAIKHARSWILIHDMIPPSIKYTQSKFCSDSFKLLQYMLGQSKLEVYPMNNNFGLTLIKMPADTLTPPNKIKDISYDEFLEFMKDKKTYSDEEMIKILNS